MPIAFPPEIRRWFAVGLLQDIPHVSQAVSAIILDPVQVVGMDEFDEEVGHVIDGIFVMKLEFPHTALGKLVENQPDWMIFWN